MSDYTPPHTQVNGPASQSQPQQSAAHEWDATSHDGTPHIIVDGQRTSLANTLGADNLQILQQQLPDVRERTNCFELAFRELCVAGEVHRLIAIRESSSQNFECFHRDPTAAASACDALLQLHPDVTIHFFLNPIEVDAAHEIGGAFAPTSNSQAVSFRRWKRVVFSFAMRSTCGVIDASDVIQHFGDFVAVLQRCGWPSPIVALSGTTALAIYEIDCGVINAVADLIADSLLVMSRRFDSPNIAIDTTTFKPDMACCLYRGAVHNNSTGQTRAECAIQILQVPDQASVIEVHHLMVLASDRLDAHNAETVVLRRLTHADAMRLTIDDFARLLRGVRKSDDGSFVARCPAHNDHDPSLSVREGDDGRILVYCHAGCSFADILHRLDLEPWQLFPPRSSREATVIQPVPVIPAANPTLHALAEQCAAVTSDHDLALLANQLGVSLASLRCLQVGWSPQHRAWTIPERRPDGWIIGVQLRSPEGQKWMVSGSHRGLILPWGWPQFSGRVYLPEGASDVAACLSHGLQAIGRPSAHGAYGLLSQLLATTPLTPVVVGENDLKPDGRWPGREGAERCASQLAAVLQRPVELVFPPPESKDIRSLTIAQGGNIR